MICYICQNEVYLPVEITCFPCYQRNNIHCFTYVRLCISCAISYLHLNKSVEDRTNVKCLFCSKHCDTKILTTNNSFCFDFWQIRENNFSEGVCPFCFKIVNTNLPDHILKTCPYFYEQCSCGRVTTKECMSLHVKYCTHYIQCKICRQHIKKFDFELHCFDHHDLFLCEPCGQYIISDDYFSHRNYRCPKRNISCEFCDKEIQFSEYEEHLLQHENDIQDALQSLREMSFRLYQKYSSIQRKRSELFQNFYLES